MIIMYNNLLKWILFPFFPYTFFPIFYIFPIPKSKFWCIMGKMGIFSILKIESLFPSLSIYFFWPFLPIPKSKFWCVLGKNGVGPPTYFIYIYIPCGMLTWNCPYIYIYLTSPLSPFLTNFTSSSLSLILLVGDQSLVKILFRKVLEKFNVLQT